MNTRKIIQALTYLAMMQPHGTLDNMKAYKLLWLADRYQLRRCGRTITGDAYYAMPYGLVPSDAKHLLENLPTRLNNEAGYMDKYIRINKGHSFSSINVPDYDEFSKSDIDVLDRVHLMFGGKSAKELSQFSHLFPEWLYYRDLIENRDAKSSYPVNVDHFFEPCKDDDSGFFDQTDELLMLTKDMFHQYCRS